jgi:PTH2 family peptidyl-tRNA hydrolase
MIKQVIVVNKELKMGKGKICSQVAHASLESYRRALAINKEIVNEWLLKGQKKVVLKADLKTILELKNYFDKKKIPNALIRDAGLTQIEPGSITTLGIGPWFEEEIDEKTKNLKLL